MNEQLIELKVVSQGLNSTIQPSKTNALALAEIMANSVIEGEQDALDLIIKADFVGKVMDELKSNLKESAIEEFEKYGEKRLGKFNYNLEVTEAGVKYDYSKCNDLIYQSLEDELKIITEKVKERQKFLKGLPKEGMQIVDEDSGETYKIYPPSKSSTTTLKMTLGE